MNVTMAWSDITNAFFFVIASGMLLLNAKASIWFSQLKPKVLRH